MEVILSHVHTDFDGLASMCAAQKLHPQAHIVINPSLTKEVQQYMAIYRDTLNITPEHQIKWDKVEHIILVDVAQLHRLGKFASIIGDREVTYTVYDHHPFTEDMVRANTCLIEPTGAAVTLLLEEIRRRKLSVSAFEATLFGLGIYTDTGCFTFPTTTARDLRAVASLFDDGLDLELVRQFSKPTVDSDHQHVYKQLLLMADEMNVDGLKIVISTYQQETYQKDVGLMASKLLEVTDADAVLVIATFGQQTFVIGRARSNRLNFQPLMKELGGGGHKQASAAKIKTVDQEAVLQVVHQNLDQIIRPAVQVKQMMHSPVQTISAEATIDEAQHVMIQNRFSGLPVCQGEDVIGIISRRDLDKAMRHGLGHAPVKAYMCKQVITAHPEHSLEEVLQLMMKHNIGRLPVLQNESLVGIITRSDVISMLHQNT